MSCAWLEYGEHTISTASMLGARCANVFNFRTLTFVFIRAGGEEDAQPGLEVDCLAGGVSAAGLDAVVEDESAGLAVEHVLGRGVHEARDDLEGDEVGGAVASLLGRTQRGQHEPHHQPGYRHHPRYALCKEGEMVT